MTDEPERLPGKPIWKLKPCKPWLEDGPFKITEEAIKLLAAKPFVPAPREGRAGVDLVELHQLERRKFFQYCLQLEREAKDQ